MEALREAGIHNCDVVIVCIGEKVDVSVLTTMSVIEMGVPRVIAKALSPGAGGGPSQAGGGGRIPGAGYGAASWQKAPVGQLP